MEAEKQEKTDLIDTLKQLGFKIEFDVDSDSWYASRSHAKARIVVSSESPEGLAYEIIRSYQALLTHSYNAQGNASSSIS